MIDGPTVLLSRKVSSRFELLDSTIKLPDRARYNFEFMNISLQL